MTLFKFEVPSKWKLLLHFTFLYGEKKTLKKDILF